LGVEAWAVRIEIEQMLGEPCAALRAFVLQTEMVPPLPLHFGQGKRSGAGKWMDVSVPVLFRPCNGRRNTSYFLLVLLANTLSANLSCLPGRLWYSHCVALVIPDGIRATAPAHPALRRAPSPIARRFVCAF
jgi:hypothetical protein